MTRLIGMALMLLLPLAFAQPFSESQNATIIFSFNGSADYSSIFAYFPENWTSPQPIDFSCPSDWIRDADTTRKAHCACAAPCKNLLSDPTLELNTTAPAAGEYVFRLLAFGPKSLLLTNESMQISVQTPPKIGLESSFPSVLASKLAVPINVVIQNNGQATFTKGHVDILVGEADFQSLVGSTDVPDVLGQTNVSLNISITANLSGYQPLYFRVLGRDANTELNVSNLFSKSVHFVEPANLSLIIGLNNERISLGQPIHVPTLVTNRGQTMATNVVLTLKSGERNLAQLSAFNLSGGEKQAATLDARLNNPGIHDLIISAEYVEPLSNQHVITKTNFQVSVVTPPSLQLSAEPYVLDSKQTATITVALFNNGTESALNTTTRFLDATGGCRLLGADTQYHGEVGEPVVVSDWTILAPAYGSDCQLFFQANGTDTLTGQTTQSSVLGIPVHITSKSSASFDALSNSNIHFEQSGDKMTAFAPLGTDWTIALAGDSQYARLVAMVENISEKQNLLEAKVDRLMLYAQTQDQTNGNNVQAQLAVQLTRVPPPSTKVDVVLIPVQKEHDLLFASVAEKNGVQLSEAAALLRVDKNGITNQDDVTNAMVTFRVSKSWVDARGGPFTMQAFRSDGTELQMLNTSFRQEIGNDYEFVAQSPNGLSLYALYALKRAQPDTPSGKTGLVISGFNEQAYAGIALLLIIAGYFYVTMRTKKHGKKPVAWNQDIE